MNKLIAALLILLAGCRPAASPAAVATPLSVETVLPSSTPTAIPFTATPAPTATLEPTPTALPRFFTHEFETALAGWVLRQSGTDAAPLVRTENGNLVLQLDSPFLWVYAIYEAHEYEDIRIDAQFTNQAGSPASIGLICRYSESEGWLEFNVSSDGSYSVLRAEWLADGIAGYRPVLSGTSNAIPPGGSVQQIGMVCSDMTLLLFIEQTLIRSVDVSSYELSMGKAGIAVSSFENAPVVAAFDRVQFSEP